MSGKVITAHLMTGKSDSRKKYDHYRTPKKVIYALLKREYFDKNKSFLECACGNGRISEMLKRVFGKDVDLFSSDLYDYGYGDEIGIDFAKNKSIHKTYKKSYEEEFTENSFDFLVSNPPYQRGLLIPIIKNCKKIARKKIALLLKLAHLSGRDRYNEIYQDKEFPLSKVYVFVKRLQFGVKDKYGRKLLEEENGL